jgi:23S rRNA pseudouridine955/2504/2580 synthase/23S rRNA pseudouridine1911/1915/1917 synthase
MQSIGHSLVCDEIYGDGKPFMLSTIKKKYNLAKNELEERPLLSRLALHAYKLEFNKPNGETITVEAPLPKDIMACVNQLNKWCAPQQ